MTGTTTMTALTVADAQAVADRVVELVRSKALDAETEVTVRGGTDALTRFANSFIHQNVAESVSHLLVRVAVDGRTAATSLDGPTDDETLGRVIDGVLEAARVRPEDPDWPGVSPRAEAPRVDHWDEATAAASPDERARRVRDFVDAAGGLETAGACSTEAATVAFANSAGQRLSGRATLADLDGIARTPTSDGSGRLSAARVDAIDGRVLGERAATKARGAADPTDLEPGRYEVVLEPYCVANLVQFLFVYGFNGRPVEEGRSFVKLGERQLDESIDLRDDVTDPGQVGVPFDVEGTPRRRVDVVTAGVTKAILHTRRTAARAGVESTGHAVEGGEQWGALPTNSVLSPGERSPEALVGGVERGLLVTDLWYTRVLDPRTLVVTGLTRNGVWLVENGRIVRPVKNLRFTQSYIEALAPDAIRGIGSDASLISGGFGGSYLVPSLHLASWNFTGGARG
ncbi:MAG TPA: metallopeptidase TldD-related protein [Candidatus Limnocylindrales bacterium]|jgi:predicted Zn-dependent protease|nr:metallopeptidase TldD-related protein [Candidatus Limnocylindrales bacterium]